MEKCQIMVNCSPERAEHLVTQLQWRLAEGNGEALYELGKSMGPDVRVCPCKTMVPFYRKHVFAQIKPSTRSRIDFGFALRDTPASGRLKDTGGFAKGDRISHCVPITSLEEIDAEVAHWLMMAYDMTEAV